MQILGSSNSDNLIPGGSINVLTKPVIVKAGQSYKRGTVLGLNDTDGKASIVNSANIDGSQRPYGILADDVDATQSDKPAVVYYAGEFNPSSLIFGGTDTVATHNSVLREIGIFLKNTISY